MAKNPTGGGNGDVGLGERDHQSAKILSLELLKKLVSTSPPLYLSPSPDLSHLSRNASKNLFTTLVPLCRPKSLPLTQLLSDENFDAEQIWHQIEFQSKPMVKSGRRSLRTFDGLGAEEWRKLFGVVDEEDELDEEVDALEENQVESEEEEEEEEEESEDEKNEDKKKKGIFDHGFFDTDELEEFLETEEKLEYEGNSKNEDDEEEEDDDDDEIGAFNEELSDDDAPYEKYDDFFGKKKKATESSKKNKKSTKTLKDIEDKDEWDEQNGHEDSFDGSQESEKDDDPMNDAESGDNKNNDTLSNFEKQSQIIKSQIDEIEKDLLGPKSWTMTGEITGSKRPKNSALEVDLDFQHNRSRPPIEAEENTASIEDIIMKRIREGNFDDVQRQAELPSKAPKESKQLDENKSQKGLAEIYEEEFAQTTGLANAPLSLTDEQKKEADSLFKKLCYKLDALSHFHFTPKPIIEDLSVSAINLPALAMEEIAPSAVSDAAMLAPEEIFSGKGNIKEDAELSKVDRKRRRAKNKRIFKAETIKRTSKKAKVAPITDLSNEKE
ncbi:hypothetical protein ZOSMA_160G00200 [Zostera marina]|uniref:U3 small nucleolar ribonucleoprotein protein MPP10 n=1 Tax=Zostera marina TaxID=29655 RepID=A0A0K9PUI7_ZOSMR|nr:hypothetical protein ZOSMA_160G00200 [Zostera marina]